MPTSNQQREEGTSRLERADRSAQASLDDLTVPDAHTVRGYYPPRCLGALPSELSPGVKRDVAEFIRLYSIHIKQNGALSMNFDQAPPYEFFTAAKRVCEHVYGQNFTVPAAGSPSIQGEQNTPPLCQPLTTVEFPLDVHTTSDTSRFPDLTLLPLEGIDMQVAYTALSLLRAAFLLERFKSPKSWWNHAAEDPWMRKLRAHEVDSRSPEFRIRAEGRDPAKRSIRLAIGNGHNTLDAISRATRLPYRTVRSKVDGMGCPVGLIKSDRLDTLLREGERDISYLCETLGLEPLGLWTLFHAKEREVDARTVPGTKDSRPLAYSELTQLFDPPALEMAVLRGDTLVSIGEQVFHGVTREFARQQLEARNLNELRIRQRARRLGAALPREVSRSDLVRVLAHRALTSPASEAERLATVHALQPSSRQSVRELLPRYQALLDGLGRGASLAQISKELDISYPTLQAFVRRSPLKIPGFPRKHAGYIDYTVYGPRVERCLALGFSLGSIERFFKRRLPKIQIKNTGPRAHDYHTASEVYEAADLGFSKTQIAQLLGINQRFVSRALYRRTVNEPIIIDGLRVLFNDDSIDRPYRYQPNPNR